MSAKNSDDRRIAEIYRVIAETGERMDELAVDEEAFKNDESVHGRIVFDSLFMCVFRVAEEAGNVSSTVKSEYPEIPWREIYGMRNILAHDYGDVDRDVVWRVIVADFPVLNAFCERYAHDKGVSLDEIE